MFTPLLKSYELDGAVEISGSYDTSLILVSLFMSFWGAYAGLALIGKIRENSTNKVNYWTWVTLASIAWTGGILCMHLLGKNAYTLVIPQKLDTFLTLLSFLPVLFGTLFAVLILGKELTTTLHRWLAGCLVGLGVVATNYIGTIAIQVNAIVAIMPWSFAVSILFSVVLVGGALNCRTLLTVFYKDNDRWLSKLCSPLIIALSIAAINYLGMSATHFFSGDSINLSFGHTLDSDTINVTIFFLILVSGLIATLAAYHDQRFSKKSKITDSLVKADVRREFVRLFVPSVITLLIIFSIVVYVYVNNKNLKLSLEVRSNAELLLSHSETELSEVLANADSLMAYQELLNVFNNKLGAIEGFAQRSSGLMMATKRYDQIRVINTIGDEVIRINYNSGNPKVVASENLQNKSTRQYFKNAFDNLNKGQFSLSDFSLNQENGKVELPYKVVLHFSAPIYNESGLKVGVLVLNYLGDVLLNKLRRRSSDLLDSVLIDSHGNYLMGHNSIEDWSALKGNNSVDFSSMFPKVWEAVQSRRQGELETSTSITSFIPVLQPMESLGLPVQGWTVVTHSKSADFSIQELLNYPTFIIVFLIMLIAVFLICRTFSINELTRNKELERSETLLRELNFLKDAIDHHAIVSGTDIKGNILFCNDKFCDISGYKREELIGQNHRMLKSGEHSKAFFRNLWRTIGHGDIWHGEIKNLTKQGTEYWVNATIVPFLNVKGRPFQYIAIRTEITQNKRLSEELKLAVKKSNFAAQAKSDFLANMSHEIRTPMNAIIGLTNLCLRTDLSNQQLDYIKKTNRAANSLLGIINDILDFSKIEAGKLSIEEVPYRLDEVIDNFFTIVADKANQKGLELLFSRASDVPIALIGDSLRLGQVLINLVSNAIKFTEQGQVVLYIRALNTSNQKVTLEFVVEDSGIGMSKEQSESLFQPFSQADNSTTRMYGGTGLGLSISKKLVEMMNGTIWAESEQGKGSRFGFTIDARIGNNVSDNTFPTNTDLKGMHVLVVDDNTTAQEIFTDYLNAFSFKVTAVSSGAQAMEELKSAVQPYRLVILDWKLGIENGLEIAKKIAENSFELVVIPKIIMVSAFAKYDLNTSPDSEYLDAFLRKPITPSTLFDTIMVVFGKSQYSAHVSSGRYNFETDKLRLIQGAHILLVEDNEINQQVAREQLVQACFYVDIANNGQEALNMLDTGRYDLVLMDIQMPVMDGYEATKNIRANPKFKDLPIIAMTANVMKEDIEQAILAGMNDHIAKPINEDSVLNTLFKWLSHGERDLNEYSRLEVNKKQVLPEIPGLDTKSGLARMGGDINAYCKILLKFTENQGNVISKVREGLTDNNQEVVSRLLHTLKGVTGNIGATSLYNAVISLEVALEEDQTQFPEDLLMIAEIEMRLLLGGIKGNCEPTLSSSTTKEASWTSVMLIQQLNILLLQLEQYDTAAEKTLEQIITKAGDSEIKEKLKIIAEKISSYDFEGGIINVKQLIDDVTVS